MGIFGLNTDHTYLFDHTEALPQPIRQLSDEEVQKLKYANDVVFEFQYYYRRMLEIDLNFAEYQRVIKKHSKRLTESKDYEYLMNETFVDINRTFLNFVTSLKVFVEHLEKRLKKKYSEQSKEYVSFKSIVNSLYDRYFSYRLLIKYA